MPIINNLDKKARCVKCGRKKFWVQRDHSQTMQIKILIITMSYDCYKDETIKITKKASTNLPGIY